MKRAKILLGLVNNGGLGTSDYQKFVNSKNLDMKSRLDRSLFAGNPVMFNGVAQVPCATCEPLVAAPEVICPACNTCVGGCQASNCAMHQY